MLGLSLMNPSAFSFPSGSNSILLRLTIISLKIGIKRLSLLVRLNTSLDLMPWYFNLIFMYYDIIQVESVDENGNTIVTLEPQTVPPVYDDIKPEDMSLENQQKAGLTLNKARTKQPSQLSVSDNVGSQIVAKGETLVRVDPEPELTSEPSPEPNPEPKKE